MTKFSFILFLAGCILVFSCPRVKKSAHQKMMEDLNKGYHESKSFFDNKFTTHFPDVLNESIITYSNSISPVLGSLGLMVIDRLNKENLVQIQKNYEQTCLRKYKASDSCLLIVDRFLTRKKYYKVENSDYDKKLVDRPCYSGKYPVPNFWHNVFTTNETECKLPGDFILYVIDAKQGKFLKEDLLTNGWFMPKQWKNGYSKGVAISQQRNVIIYWLEIW